MLEMGNGGRSIYVSHFLSWAARKKAPLLKRTDLRKICKEYLEVFLNKDVIAVNQDSGQNSVRRAE
jgi:alpha-galactosidase